MAVDLGFAGLLDKFEEYWGKTATRWLLMLIGIAVVAGCVGAIWGWLISPILTFLESPIWQRTILSLALAVLGVGLGVGVGLYLIAAVRHLRGNRRLDKMLAHVRDLIERAESVGGRVNDSAKKASELLDQTTSLLGGSIGLARAMIENDASISDEDRARKLAEIDEAEASLTKAWSVESAGHAEPPA